MRLGIDGSCWSNRRGFGRFTRCLVREMVRRQSSHTFVLVIDGPSRRDADLPDGLEVVEVAVGRQSEAASSSGRRRAADLVRMSLAARRAGCSSIYFPATYTYYPVPGTPAVVTIHDTMADRHPELAFGDRQAWVAWRLKQRLAIRAAAAVVTVSLESRRNLIGFLKVDEDSVHVIREAPDSLFRPVPARRRAPLLARHGLGQDDRYLLYAGGISPHKNLGVLLAAFEQVAARHPDVRLVVVGDTEHDPFLSSAGDLRKAVGASPVGDRVLIAGYVDDQELVALYGGAVATALPSLDEGFGLTAAESAACGTPVVASDIPALVELLGDAALYAAPHRPESFAAAFGQLLDDSSRRQSLADASLSRAATWSWGPAAETVVHLLELAASS